MNLYRRISVFLFRITLFRTKCSMLLCMHVSDNIIVHNYKHVYVMPFFTLSILSTMEDMKVAAMENVFKKFLSGSQLILSTALFFCCGSLLESS